MITPEAYTIGKFYRLKSGGIVRYAHIDPAGPQFYAPNWQPFTPFQNDEVVRELTAADLPEVRESLESALDRGFAPLVENLLIVVDALKAEVQQLSPTTPRVYEFKPKPARLYKMSIFVEVLTEDDDVLEEVTSGPVPFVSTDSRLRICKHRVQDFDLVTTKKGPRQ